MSSGKILDKGEHSAVGVVVVSVIVVVFVVLSVVVVVW